MYRVIYRMKICQFATSKRTKKSMLQTNWNSNIKNINIIEFLWANSYFHGPISQLWKNYSKRQSGILSETYILRNGMWTLRTRYVYMFQDGKSNDREIQACEMLFLFPSAKTTLIRTLKRILFLFIRIYNYDIMELSSLIMLVLFCLK